MAGSSEPKINGSLIFSDMSRNIENSKASLGIYISRLFTPYYTSDQALIKARDWVNDTIDRFRHKPATAENCQLLKRYIEEQMGKMMERPQSEARFELIKQCLDRIKTLESGIKWAQWEWRNRVVKELNEDRHCLMEIK